ncbi:MAG: MATE family efflux transporter [Spirochaetaceae bacterium]|jgi:putative MATE family efflux protein|nr:MATE family efflux transporter [Spirochaetaceae bacterium]GMO22588.1 MAG: MATE family efflux transporter [Termitinemataceae bacterium]
MGKNLTSGTPGLVILAFAIPLVIGNVFQQLYSMADAFVVSQEIGIAGLAAITSTGSLQFLVLGFLIGVTSGASIITAQRYGAADSEGVRRSFTASIIICAFIAVVLMIISISVLRPLLVLLNTPPEIFEGSYNYFVMLLWGMPTVLLFNLLSNVMRAVGDSKTPLYYLILACVINVALDYFFIGFLGMGVIGAGLATIIAQLVSGLLCIPSIYKNLPMLRITRADWKLPVSEYIEHLKIALPVGFQWSIIAIGAVAVTFSLNGLGYEAVAAFNIGQRIDQFAGMPLASYGQALTTFTAQNYGAKKYSRIRTGAAQGCLISSAFTVLMGVVFIISGDSISRIFLKDNAVAVALAHKYLIILGAFFVLLALLYTCRQVVQGIGNAIIPTISGIFELFMRGFAALVLTRYFGYTGLCFASPLAFAGALIPLSIGFFIVLKRIKLLELRSGKL